MCRRRRAQSIAAVMCFAPLHLSLQSPCSRRFHHLACSALLQQLCLGALGAMCARHGIRQTQPCSTSFVFVYVLSVRKGQIIARFGQDRSEKATHFHSLPSAFVIWYSSFGITKRVICITKRDAWGRMAPHLLLVGQTPALLHRGSEPKADNLVLVLGLCPGFGSSGGAGNRIGTEPPAGDNPRASRRQPALKNVSRPSRSDRNRPTTGIVRKWSWVVVWNTHFPEATISSGFGVYKHPIPKSTALCNCANHLVGTAPAPLPQKVTFW